MAPWLWLAALGCGQLAGPDRATALTEPQGYFLLQGTDRAQSIPSSLLSQEGIAGLSVRFSWAQLEPRRGAYDWSSLDAEIERAKGLSKTVMIRPMAGIGAPVWLYEAGAESLTSKKSMQMPKPWDPVMLEAWGGFIAALGDRYADEPALALVHLSGPVSDSAEMHLPPSLAAESGAADRVFTAWKTVIDAYAAAFPTTAVSLNMSNPLTGRDGLVDRVVDYAISVLGERATLQNNSLSARTTRRFDVVDLLARKSAEGVRVGFQMLSPSPNPRFGGDFAQAIAFGDEQGARFYEIYMADAPRVPGVDLEPFDGRERPMHRGRPPRSRSRRPPPGS